MVVHRRTARRALTYQEAVHRPLREERARRFREVAPLPRETGTPSDSRHPSSEGMGRGKNYTPAEDAEILRLLGVALGAQREGIEDGNDPRELDVLKALCKTLTKPEGALQNRKVESIRARARRLVGEGAILDVRRSASPSVEEPEDEAQSERRVTRECTTSDSTAEATSAVVAVEHATGGDESALTLAPETVKWHRDGMPALFFRRNHLFVREDAEKSTFTWGEEVVARCREEFDDWAQTLEETYPVRYDGKNRLHPSETLSYRNTQCQKERDACWDTLDRRAIEIAWKQAMPGTVPIESVKYFRVDAFGNVVSDRNRTGSKAVCAFDVDHVFPWSRGGCSRRGNFAGLYWGANVLKKDKLIQGAELSPQPCLGDDRAGSAGSARGGGAARGLQVGLSVEMFIALFRHSRDISTSRQDMKYCDNLAVHWLTCSRPKGQSKADLWSELGLERGGELEPAALWNAFASWQRRIEDQMSRGVAENIRSTTEAESSSSGADGTRESASASRVEKKAATESGSRGGVSNSSTLVEVEESVLLLVDRGSLIARGKKTYDIRIQLKELGFKWSAQTMSWFRAFEKEIVARVEDEARGQNIPVNVLHAS